MKYTKFLVLFFFCVLSLTRAYATHLRAGEITAVRISPVALTYRFTLTVYRDNCGNCADLSPNAELEFNNDEKITVPLSSSRMVSGDIEEGVYIGVYTFTGAGTFKVSYTERYRNGCIRNMSTPLETELFIETEVVVNPFMGQNSTPKLSALPVDNASVGAKFLHNPGAFDPDGDSLSFELVNPKMGFEKDVRNFQPLNNFLTAQGEDGGAPVFGINIDNGTMTWDAPKAPGCYNVAIKVSEWRKGKNGKYNYLGYVIRDMQIIVKVNDNKRPRLKMPDNVCIEAGKNLNVTIEADDPDKDKVAITAVGQILDKDFPNPKASVTPNDGAFRPVPTSVNLKWTPTCEHIRKRPYQVVFKAEDLPPQKNQSLVDIQVFEITVVGPKPTGLTATADNVNNEIALTWDPYTCAKEADSLIVWRKEGCSTDPGECDTGAPDGQGFVEIARLPKGATSYIDKDVKTGLKYSYRISAIFPAPTLGESYASDEQCIALLVDTPLFTKVDVVETDQSTGKIDVQFIEPFEFDPPLPAGTAFFYKVYRQEEGSDTKTEVFSANSSLGAHKVFDFQDAGLNTLEKTYYYQIAFSINTAANFKDSSDVASSVRLQLTPNSNCIELKWVYDVPWSNRDFDHDVAKNTTGDPSISADKIGEDRPIRRAFGQFQDGSVQQRTVYFYKTRTTGSYHNDKIITIYGNRFKELNNRSQISSAEPIDDIKPCPPELRIDAKDCEAFDFTSNPPYTNILHWTNPQGDNGATDAPCGEKVEGCEFEEDNISVYKIYFKAPAKDTYELVTQIDDKDIKTYSHEGLSSLAGCYVMTAVDRAGNESDFSNEVCVDNCLRFELPNVFSPNDDGIDDVFRAVNYKLYRLSELANAPVTVTDPENIQLKFVEQVDITVFNRWGAKVYYRNNDINILWNGKKDLSGTSAGQGADLPAGMYYYEAKVTFITVDPNKRNQTFKGWVQIIR